MGGDDDPTRLEPHLDRSAQPKGQRQGELGQTAPASAFRPSDLLGAVMKATMTRHGPQPHLDRSAQPKGQAPGRTKGQDGAGDTASDFRPSDLLGAVMGGDDTRHDL